MSIILLSQMAPGQTGAVKDLSGAGDICQRLLEMGVTRGATVEVVRFAPLGDPIDIRVRGYHLSLRKKEAEAIRVEIAEAPQP